MVVMWWLVGVGALSRNKKPQRHEEHAGRGRAGNGNFTQKSSQRRGVKPDGVTLSLELLSCSYGLVIIDHLLNNSLYATIHPSHNNIPNA